MQSQTTSIAPKEGRASFKALRIFCDDIGQRADLGMAIKNGWTAAALLDLAKHLRRGTYGHKIDPAGPARREAILIGAMRMFDFNKPYWHMPIASMSNLSQFPRHGLRRKPTTSTD